MRFRNNKMLLYIGMGDAYGMATEYIKFPRDNDIRAQSLRLLGYVKHPTHQDHPGLYTDDTEMSAANTRVLIANDAPYTKLQFADAYVAEFARGGRRKGYSRGFQALLEEIGSGTELLERLRPDSDKNGAAMRAVPFGVIKDIGLMLEVVTMQAAITHDTPVGRFSARAVALMSHYALYEDKPLSKIGIYCADHLPKEDAEFLKIFHKPWPGLPVVSGPQGSIGLTSVWSVAHLVSQERSLRNILLKAIHWGGDVDSTAAISWGIASARYQDELLPDFLERDLERGNPHTGAPYLIDLGTRLMDKYA
jgi:ADP-ribosyl-[dinitrogen reductase] hydrolase